MAPAVPRNTPEPGPRRGSFMATTKSSAPPRTRSTRHHRVDHSFIELLEEDFGIPYFALSNAFMGVPAEPKKQAIALCEGAARTDNPARALLAWAHKNHRGTFRPCEDADGAVGDE
jgi:hypothetical protein